jgi:hypothetical protein
MTHEIAEGNKGLFDLIEGQPDDAAQRTWIGARQRGVRYVDSLGPADGAIELRRTSRAS